MSSQDEESRVHELKTKFSYEAKLTLNKLNYKRQQSREFLVKSYRELNKILSRRLQKNYQYSSGYISASEDPKLIDKVTSYAFNIQNYPRSNQTIFNSILCEETTMACRRCSLPAVSVDGELVNFESKFEKTIVKDKEFALRIDAEPNGTILYTINSLHPSYTQDRYMVLDKLIEIFAPPREFNIIVSHWPYKLDSQMLSLKVKYNKTANQNHTMAAHHQGVQRPFEPIRFDESQSQCQGTDQYVPIDQESY